MSKKMHPTPEMVRDLQMVFTKHNWSGQPIGLVQPKSLIDNQANGEEDPDNCPEGKVPQTVTYRLPNGDEVNKTICV
jgi:hypothetical protein